MEFVEKQKEFTHKSNKSARCKYITKVVNKCTKCYGTCIFSKAFIEKFPKSSASREKLDEKFYASEFEYIRSLLTGPKPENNKKTKSRHSEEEGEEEEDALTTFDLLRKFHSLERSEKENLGKIHNSIQFWNRKIDTRTHKLIKQEVNVCSCCTGRVENVNRQRKNNNLVLTNVCDVRLEC